MELGFRNSGWRGKKAIPEGTTLCPFAYYVYTPPYQWLDNNDEAITLMDPKGEEVGKTSVVMYISPLFFELFF